MQKTLPPRSTLLVDILKWFSSAHKHHHNEILAFLLMIKYQKEWKFNCFFGKKASYEQNTTNSTHFSKGFKFEWAIGIISNIIIFWLFLVRRENCIHLFLWVFVSEHLKHSPRTEPYIRYVFECKYYEGIVLGFWL